MSVRDLVAQLETYRLENPGEDEITELFLQFVNGAPDHLLRENTYGHVTGSAFVIDEQWRETLLVHHRKLLLWVQPGGHADGNSDIALVAEQELREESGLTKYQRVGSSIFDIDRHTIPAHNEVPEHYHYDVRFLFCAERDQELVVSDESIDLRWFKLDTIVRGETWEHKGNTDESVRRMAQKVLGHPGEE